jgi:hypothetical protein
MGHGEPSPESSTGRILANLEPDKKSGVDDGQTMFPKLNIRIGAESATLH